MKFSLALTTLALASPLLATPLDDSVAGVVPFIVTASSGKELHAPNETRSPVIEKREDGAAAAAGAGGGHGASSGGHGSSSGRSGELITTHS